MNGQTNKIAEAMYERKEYTGTRARIGNVVFKPYGEKLIVEEDLFRSGFECKVCDGKTIVPCSHCSGEGKRLNPTTKEMVECKSCVGVGTQPCLTCKGQGATIVIPDVVQRRPSTGIIRGMGPKVVDKEIGERVLYSRFAGHRIDLDNASRQLSTVVVIMNDSEAFSGIEGYLTYRETVTNLDAMGG